MAAHENRSAPAQDLPASLAAVALIDAKTAAATGAMSVSWWHERVAAGEAPQPAFRAPRCTRWRLADVAEFWRTFAERAELAAADTQAAESVKATVAKASAAAKAKRAAGAAAAAQ